MPYAGHDEFVSMATRFLADGVAEGEPALLLTDAGKLGDVRDALGGQAKHVRFVDMNMAGHNPVLLLSVLDEFIRAHDGRRVRGLGEPVHDARTPAQRAEAELHELLMNSARCQKWNAWLGCSYDTGALDEAALASMRRSHPKDGYDLANAVAAKFEAPLSPRPDGAETFSVDAADLGAVRTIVRTAATMAGLSAERADGFVCAVNEVVTNGIRHGRGPVDVALWSSDGALVCDVHDCGHILNPLAGRLAPVVGELGGRGLWLANHLCDLVQVRAPAAGTSVRMYIEP